MDGWERLQHNARKYQKELFAFVVIMLMLLTAFGLVQSYNSGTNTKGEKVGQLFGTDVFKAGERDYFMLLNGIEWHFRTNPITSNVSIRPNESFLTGPLTVANKAAILLDPSPSTRTYASAFQLTTVLGRQFGVPDVYVTSPWEGNPSIPVLTIEQARLLAGTAVFYLAEPNYNDTYVSSIDNVIYVKAASADDMDRAVTMMQVILLVSGR